MAEKEKCKNCTNEKELIEEMVKEICKVCYERQGTGTRWCEVYERKDCSAYDSAEILYNAGYRKIPEGAVVLSKEEYELFQSLEESYDHLEKTKDNLLSERSRLILQIAQTRKETAKEIFETLYEKFGLEEIGKNSRINVTKMQFLRVFREILGKEVENEK